MPINYFLKHFLWFGWCTIKVPIIPQPHQNEPYFLVSTLVWHYVLVFGIMASCTQRKPYSARSWWGLRWLFELTLGLALDVWARVGGRVGSKRLFRYQHVGIPNALNDWSSHWLRTPMRQLNVSCFLLQ